MHESRDIMIRLAIDGMGGDYAPEPIVKGTLKALETYENIEITIFGDEAKMAPFFKTTSKTKSCSYTLLFRNGRKRSHQTI